MSMIMLWLDLSRIKLLRSGRRCHAGHGRWLWTDRFWSSPKPCRTMWPRDYHVSCCNLQCIRISGWFSNALYLPTENSRQWNPHYPGNLQVSSVVLSETFHCDISLNICLTYFILVLGVTAENLSQVVSYLSLKQQTCQVCFHFHFIVIFNNFSSSTLVLAQ